MLRHAARIFVLGFLSSLTFLSAPLCEARADDVKTGEPKVAALGKPQPVDSDDVSTTRHSVKIAGKTIEYTATAGTLPLLTEDGKQKAAVFFVAYTKSAAAARRPITFCFNGGPGSASVWLHLGMLGPKRVRMKDDATVSRPPYKLIPNEFSLLDHTDLVFIDPVSTGYSRATKGESPKQFHGYEEDVKSVGQFIHAYVTQNGRWSSPKFLLGESYGTTRAAGLADHLQSRYKMFLNGVVMVSSVIDFQTIRFNRHNDLPYVLFLPSYTATAWYHKHLPSDLQKQDLRKTLKEVEKFAVEDYSVALLKGAALKKKDRRRIAEQLSRYLGVSREFVERCNLRIGMGRFAKELLRKQKRTTGRLDSRYLGIDRDSAGDSYEYDPSGAALEGPYGATINDYLRSELKYESKLPYELLSGRVHPWNFKQFTNRYVNVAEELRQAMTKNQNLKVFVASGYFDLATPYYASIYSYNHLGLDPALRKNITLGFYRAGHMMYIYEPALKKLRKDLEKFYDSAVSR